MYQDPNAPPLNPLPPVVWFLALPIIAVEAMFQMAEAGIIGGPGGIGFAEALTRLAPGAADWEALARRTRAAPERYNEYVSH